jgi:K+-sensing histidine kinase KdpD
MNPPTAGVAPVLPDCESPRLLADLFHALSQPLTTLCCSLELTLQQTPTEKQYRESVTRALAQAEQVSWLAMGIRELLDAGDAGPDLEVLQMQAAVHDAVSDLLPVAELAGVRICYLPRSPGSVRFEARRLRRGLFHLMGFVVGWGGGAVVRIELSESGEQVVLALTVSGEGIPREAMESAESPESSSPESSSPASSSEDALPRDLTRRLGLGIARATFEAAGGSFRAERGIESMIVELRLPRVAAVKSGKPVLPTLEALPFPHTS